MFDGDVAKEVCETFGDGGVYLSDKVSESISCLCKVVV